MTERQHKSGGLRAADHFGKHELNVDSDAVYAFNRRVKEAYNPDYYFTLDTFLGNTKGTDKAHQETKRKVRLFFSRLSNKTKQHIRYLCWYDKCPTSGKLHIHGIMTFEKKVIPSKDITSLWLGMVKKQLPKEHEYLDDKMSVDAWVSAVKDARVKALSAIDITDDTERINNSTFYGWRKHDYTIDEVSCPKKGSCRYRACNRVGDNVWKKIIQQRYSN